MKPKKSLFFVAVLIQYLFLGTLSVTSAVTEKLISNQASTSLSPFPLSGTVAELTEIGAWGEGRCYAVYS
jgi:hypothetical protein